MRSSQRSGPFCPQVVAPVTRLCVHRGPQPPLCRGHRAETQTPSRPLEPLCTRTVVRGQPPHHHPPSVTAISSLSPTFKLTHPPPPSSWLPHPSSPTNPHPHHAAIPLPCHLAAFRRPCTQKPIVCAGRRQKAVYSLSTREKWCVELKWTQYSCWAVIHICSWSYF